MVADGGGVGLGREVPHLHRVVIGPGHQPAAPAALELALLHSRRVTWPGNYQLCEVRI